MQAYKFETSVLENGVIQIPEMKELAHHEIIVFIVAKEVQSPRSTLQKISFAEFSKRWRGFLKDSGMDSWQKEYVHFLEEKYQ